MVKVSERLEKIPPYLFAEIDRKIAEAKAKGIDIISLGIGDPDTPTIQCVIDEMHKAIDMPKNHDYPPYNGTEEFRVKSCKWMKERFGVDLNPDTEMLINIGSKEAIAHMFFAYIDEGDYTLIPDPGYPVYYNATIFAGGTPYSMPLLEENDYLPDFDKIPEDVAKAAKIMFVTQPAVSLALRELEKEFSITLFSHSNNGLELTVEGEQFYERASALLRQSDEMQLEFQDTSRRRPTVRLGTPPNLSTVFFPELMDAFHVEHPEIYLELSEYGSVRACDMVQNGRC